MFWQEKRIVRNIEAEFLYQEMPHYTVHALNERFNFIILKVILS